MVEGTGRGPSRAYGEGRGKGRVKEGEEEGEKMGDNIFKIFDRFFALPRKIVRPFRQQRASKLLTQRKFHLKQRMKLAQSCAESAQILPHFLRRKLLDFASGSKVIL